MAQCFVYRKENFKNYESITFKCSQYRKFTKCQYQLKAKLYHGGTYKIFYSQHHEHGSLENTSLPLETRSVIRDLALNGLTISQIRKTMEVLHPDISISAKIRNIVQYEQKKNRGNITFIDDLKEWCSKRSSYPSPDEIHHVNLLELFEIFYYFIFFPAFHSIF